MNISIEYLAGLIEGEGSFLAKANGGAAITVEMTDQDIVERLLTFGGTVHGYAARKINWEPTWRWSLTSKLAFDLAKELLPYLGIRRTEQATRMMQQYQDSINRQTSTKTNIINRTATIKQLRSENNWTHQRIADELGVDRTLVSHTLRGKFG